MADASPHDFLLFLVCSLADQPAAVSVEKSDSDDGRTLYQVSVDPADQRIVADGDLADALHIAFSAFTYKHRIRASLELRS